MEARKTVWVTGASGFVGRRLCARLQAQGMRVVAIGRSETSGPWEKFVRHEFGSGAFAVGERPQAVFHLAARTHALAETPGERETYFKTNVEGMKELLGALEGAGEVRVVFASSVKACGEETPASGVDELAPSRPTTPYGESKLAAERALLSSEFGREAVVLRLAMVYGSGQKGNLVEMIRSVAKDRFPPIPENGNRRSMVHVDDVVTALLAAAEASRPGGRMYYISGLRARSSREIYEEILRGLGRPAPKWHVPAAALWMAALAGDGVERVRGRRFLWDTEKYRKLFGSAHYLPGRAVGELGFNPKRDLADAMPEMLGEV